MDEDLTPEEAAELDEFVHIAVSLITPILDEMLADIKEAQGSDMAHVGMFNGIIGASFNKMKELQYDVEDAIGLSVNCAFNVYRDKRGLH